MERESLEVRILQREEVTRTSSIMCAKYTIQHTKDDELDKPCQGVFKNTVVAGKRDTEVCTERCNNHRITVSLLLVRNPQTSRHIKKASYGHRMDDAHWTAL